jgi:Beta-propeller repeat
MSAIAAAAPGIIRPARGGLVPRALLAAILTLVLVLALARVAGSPPADGAAAPEATIPLAFVPNAGQTDPGVRFTAQGAGYGFFFTDEGVTLALERPGADRGLALELGFRGANPDVRPVAGGEAAGTVNYLVGPREEWRSGLQASSELTYPELWPGIDMVFRGEGGRLKYEFHVAPGADPSRIGLAYRGAEGLAVGAGGALHVNTALGTLKDSRPVSYQRSGGERVPVDSRYRLDGAGGYGFSVAGYDAGRALVIDPGLAYSTYLGGGTTSAHDESALALAVDSSGSAYLAGETTNPTFPTTPGAFDTTLDGAPDAFVTKLSPDGSSLAYSTYLGGSQIDRAHGIALDALGNAYVAGSTSSPNFPVTAGAFDPVFGQSTDAFLTKLDPTGSALVYSSYLGGGVQDSAQAVAVDATGAAYVTGFTSSSAFPITPGAFDSSFGAGSTDVFVTKFNFAGSDLAYSTYLSGTGIGEQGTGIAVDGAGSAYVTGFAGEAVLGTQVDYPTTAGAFDTTQNGADDVFVTKLDPTGSALGYSTFLGGSTTDQGWGIALDGQGSAYVAGLTNSTAYPTTAGAFDGSFNGGNSDAFATKLDPSGSALGYSTYLGGAQTDEALAVDVDGQGSAHLTGSTASPAYPTTPGAFDQTHSLGIEAFATRLDPAGAALSYSTLLGGNAGDEGSGVAVDAAGDIYVAGLTESSNYPTTPGAFQTTGGGAQNREAFATKLDEGGVAAAACSDGADNDGDGQTDFPADTGCASPGDASEAPKNACSDAVDNDGDGQVDHPADPGCASPADNNETNPKCDDGLDNDGDGAVDFPADPGCSSLADNNETNKQCNDGLDNDGDGQVDHPADPGCSSLADNNETNKQCNDGLDNDGDGQVDHPADPGCGSATDNSEHSDNAFSLTVAFALLE